MNDGIPPPNLPPTRPPRSPVPGWMWLLFAAGSLAAGALLTTVTGGYGLPQLWQGVLAGIAAGLTFAVPFVGGLALAGRFFSGTGGRIVGGLMFACLLTVGLGAAVFAGCMCLFPNSIVTH